MQTLLRRRLARPIRHETAGVVILVACISLRQTAYGQYTEKYEAWSATTADTWETKDLAAAPFSVPANAVVEIMVRNNDVNTANWGGVRAVGSALDRRFLLHEAENVGRDVLVMHVQTDASSDIQAYSDERNQLDFLLLGYWTSGTYVEAFSTFTAGASGSWVDKPLCSLGVRPQWVAEFVITNDDADNEHEGGVRTNGSSLQRRLNIHEAEPSGTDVATLLVRADASASATVEVYAGADASIDFYLVGYWSTAPGAYTELFANIGSPSSDSTWEDIDLTSFGVPNSATAEFVLANDYDSSNNRIGVRANGSALSRAVNLHEAESGGSDFGGMHVKTDSTATIEFYHEDVSDAHTFRLVGYWNTCDGGISYSVTDLGAITSSKSSLGYRINSSENVAGSEEDASGNPVAWYEKCGTFTSLGTLGGSYGEALGINDAEMVVGWAHDASGMRRAFRWTGGGGMVDLGTVSGRTDSEAVSVNASSEIVGSVLDSAAPPANRLAFIYLPVARYTLGAGMTSLGTLGGSQSVATDINGSGQVVGGAQNASGNMRPFRWANGVMTNLGTLGGENNSILHRAQAINSSGNVVGMSYTAAGDERAFLWNGSMTNLGVLAGGNTSWALGINDSGKIVGTSEVTGGDYHAFIYQSGTMTDLNDEIDASSGWTLIRATDINNDGFITGWGTNGSGDYRAFLLTPSCSAGGGGSVLLATTSGQTDEAGAYEGVAVGESGERLAAIEVVEAYPEETFTISVTAAPAGAPGVPGAGAPSDPGDGLVLPRTLKVASAAEQGTFKLTVHMSYAVEELGERQVAPQDLELYVFDATEGAPPGTWAPAGTNIGEAVPTGVMGDSGFLVRSDNSVDYWAVRDDGGVFAVGGKAGGGGDDGDGGDNGEGGGDAPPAAGVPRPCGLGMIHPFLLGLFVLARKLGTGTYYFRAP